MKRRRIDFFVVGIKRTLCSLLIVCCLGWGSAFAAANEQSRTVAVNYVVRSLGSDIGTVRAKTVGTARDNDFHADVNVNVRFWFLGFSLTSSESASIRGGKLVSYHKTIDTKGQRREIIGKLSGDIFKIVNREGDKEEHKDIPVTSYVTTNMESPEMALASGEVRKMRIADLENTGIIDREYRHVAEESSEIDGRSTRVMVADFTDKYAEGRRWTASIGGLPIVLRQEGKEKTGLFNPAYKVLQTRVSIE